MNKEPLSKKIYFILFPVEEQNKLNLKITHSNERYFDEYPNAGFNNYMVFKSGIFEAKLYFHEMNISINYNNYNEFYNELVLINRNINNVAEICKIVHKLNISNLDNFNLETFCKNYMILK